MTVFCTIIIIELKRTNISLREKRHITFVIKPPIKSLIGFLSKTTWGNACLISHEFPAPRKLMTEDVRLVREHHMFCVLTGPRLNYRTSGQAGESSGTAGRAETGTRFVGAEIHFLWEQFFSWG